MTNMKFNLNNYVQVKLTEKGKQVLNQKIDNDLAILNRYGIDTSTYDRSEPQDGYWKFQLWEVMQIFGPYMKQGLENVIEMDIVLEVEVKQLILVEPRLKLWSYVQIGDLLWDGLAPKDCRSLLVKLSNEHHAWIDFDGHVDVCTGRPCSAYGEEGILIATGLSDNPLKISNIALELWAQNKEKAEAFVDKVRKECGILEYPIEQKSDDVTKPLLPESLSFLKEEVQKARKKFPGAEDLTVALMEEAGELAQATLKCDSENIKKEALQVACVAMRIFEEGDSTFTKRVGISQDEKYEYEKILKSERPDTIANVCYLDNLYMINIMYSCYSGNEKYSFRAISNSKPSKTEFIEIVNFCTENICIFSEILDYKGWKIQRVR